MKMLNVTLGIYIVCNIYKAIYKVIYIAFMMEMLRESSFPNIFFFKGWCGGNLAIRIKIISKVFILLKK